MIGLMHRPTWTVAWTALLMAAAPVASGAQESATAGGAAVEALVYDSVAGKPLPYATVQLVLATDPVGFSRTGETDLRGRFTFEGIPAGRYRMGFMHPLLDALGIAAPVREVQVAGDQPVRVDLAIPSSRGLQAAVCGPGSAIDSTSVLLGTVRDPRNLMPVEGAEVVGRWLEVTFGTGGISQRIAHVAATTGTNGWFALCGLPSGTVTVGVRSEVDTTTTLDLQIEPRELRRRDLYVAAPGRGQLQGRVVDADSARGLPGARVTVVGGGQAEADGEGRWAISNVPFGTRMVEVRAIGYYPVSRAVDVVAEPGAVDVSLETFKAVLDAVRVTASRNAPADLGGFAERRRQSGMGRYMSGEQIARRNPVFTSDLLKTMPGFLGDGSLTMNGIFSDGGGNLGVACAAEVYVDGHLMRGISAGELDALVSPENIDGIEVYSAGSPKPAQFESGMSGCGSLVIWQKPMGERMRRR